MIALEIIQHMWQIIEFPEPTASKVEARQFETVAVPEGNPLLTIDQLGQRHLLIPVEWDAKVIEDKQSAGVHVRSNLWGDEEGKRRYIDVVCLKPHLNDLFDMIVFDILAELGQDASSPGRSCRQVLNQWRELLSHETVHMPDKTTLIGIWGELWILRELVKRNPHAVDIWTGPVGGRYDFWATKLAMEIKSTTQRKGYTVTVHGHDQLEIPQNGELYLVFLRLEESPKIGESVSSLVNDITDLGCDRIKLLTKLANLGLTLDLIAKCEESRFRLMENRIYHVDQGFPRITSASFKGEELPNGVISLSYQIDLTSEPPHPLRAEQAMAIYEWATNEQAEQTVSGF